jgi:phosphotransferase system IIB component
MDMSKGGGDNITNKFNKMKCLQEYLQHLQLRKEYDEKKVGVAQTLKKKEDYVQQ